MPQPRVVTPRRGSGLTSIVAAAAVAGVAGYVVTWLVFRSIGAADYADFAIFWSATYLLVGALSGIQQEVTRATRIRRELDPDGAPLARNFAVVAAVAIVVVIVALLPLWSTVVFPQRGGELTFPLAVATGTYVVVAVVAGTLYGLALWSAVALMITVDGILRLSLIAAGLALHTGPMGLAWAVAIPFPVSAALVWLLFRRQIVGRSAVDVTARSLVWNVVRTVAAAASTGVLVSGFPVILKLTAHDVGAATLGVVILAVTLVRAPLIVTAMSLQSFLIVQLRSERGFWRRLLRLIALIAAAGVVVSIVGGFAGPPLFLILFGAEAVVPTGLVVALVASSTLVAVLFVTGPALLSRGRHREYTVGWLAAAVATIIGLLIPLPFLDRTLLSLCLGPAIGLLVHVAGLAFVQRALQGMPDA